MTTIVKDKFVQFAENLLSEKQPFITSELDFSFPIMMDLDPINQQKRKQQQMLTRKAQSNASKVTEAGRKSCSTFSEWF